MKIIINKIDKVIVVPHGTQSALPVDKIKEMGFSIAEAPIIKNITTKFFKKNKIRKKKKKNNYKKK